MKFIDVKTELKSTPITRHKTVFNWKGDKLITENEVVYAIELTRRIKICFIPLPKLSFYIAFNDCEDFQNISSKFVANKPIKISCIGKDVEGSEYECTTFRNEADAEAIIGAMQNDPNCFIL